MMTVLGMDTSIMMTHYQLSLLALHGWVLPARPIHPYPPVKVAISQLKPKMGYGLR